MYQDKYNATLVLSFVSSGFLASLASALSVPRMGKKYVKNIYNVELQIQFFYSKNTIFTMYEFNFLQ